MPSANAGSLAIYDHQCAGHYSHHHCANIKLRYEKTTKLGDHRSEDPKARLRRTHRNMSLESDIFTEIRLPQQRSYGADLFPAVITRNPSRELDLSQFEEAVERHKLWLEAALRRSGAILLRDFPVKSASDFNRVVEAFGYEELPYFGVASRTKVIGRVYTANESPPEQKIHFHHEMAHASLFPSKLFFFCEEEPKSGGETPIVLSHLVYERIKERYPAFVESLEQHGMLLITELGDESDPSSPVGRGWKLLFSTDDRSIAEQRSDVSFINLLFILKKKIKRLTEEHSVFAFKLVVTNEHSSNGGVHGGLVGVVLKYLLKTPLNSLSALKTAVQFLRAAQLGMKLEWIQGGAKVVIGPIPAIRTDEMTGRKAWFIGFLYATNGDPKKNPPMYGDGVLMPIDTLTDCVKIPDEESVAIPWKKGDILLLDNMAVLHSRQPFEPPRCVLVSLCK